MREQFFGACGGGFEKEKASQIRPHRVGILIPYSTRTRETRFPRKKWDLKMTESNYYITLTSPFRTVDVAKYVTFTSEGFSYTSPSIAFVLTQTSKNRYVVRAIYAGKFEEYSYTSQKTAVEFAVKLLSADRAGAFRKSN